MTSEIMLPTADAIKVQIYQSMDERHLKPAGHNTLANALSDAYIARGDEELMTAALHHYSAAMRGVKPGSFNEVNLRHSRLVLYLHEYENGRVSSDVLLEEIRETNEILLGVRTRRKAERRADLLAWLAETYEYVKSPSQKEAEPNPTPAEASSVGAVATESFFLSMPEPGLETA